MDSIQDAIQGLSKTGDELYAKVCEVVSVNAGNKTCDLQPVDDSAKLFDIPFNADVDVDGLVNYPKQGSHVLVVFLDKHNAQICNVSELDKSYLKIGTVEFKVDSTGFMLKKQNENLKKLMADLLTAIKSMKFTTNQGPTINLVNIADFIALETRFNNLLKDN
jgi:hypothetical protein